MKITKTYRLDERVLKLLSELSDLYGSSDTQVIQDAIRLYYRAEKAKDGEVWNMDEIKCIM